MSRKHSIAFIGLGSMGLGMAGYLAQEGFAVCGYDLNPFALERLLALGGTAASTPRECADGKDIVICMVASSAQVTDVFFTESTGAVFGLSKGCTVILGSTVPPSFPTELLDSIHSKFQRSDICLLDCPVSGGSERAALGKLLILASGPMDAFIKAYLVLDSMSEKLYQIEGPLGTANRMKLVNQHLAGIHIVASAEAMGLAAVIGLNTIKLYESVQQSAANSWMFENRVPRMLASDWTPLSAVNIFVKDMGIVAAQGLDLDFPLYVAAAAEKVYIRAEQAGYGKEDDAGIVRLFVPQDPSLVSKAATHEKECLEGQQRIFGIIHGLLEAVHIMAAAEALALGRAMNLSPDSMVPIISTAAGASESFKKFGSHIVHSQIENSPSMAEIRDSLKQAVTLARTYHYPLHLADLTLQLFQKAASQNRDGGDDVVLMNLFN